MNLTVRTVAALLIGSSLLPTGTAAANQPTPGTVLVYVGTYTGKKSQGIYVSRLDPKTGAMTAPELAGEMTNPSWITLHPSGKFLFAAGEGGQPNGGAVGGFAIGADGKLSSINKQAPNGTGPCHLAIDATGTTILAANYGDGSVASLAIAADGSLSASTWVDKHPVLGEKQKPHAHSVDFAPGNRFALSCDAGIDRIYVYRFDAKTGTLMANDPPFATTTPETHPRHLAFSPDGKFCYDIDERSMSVTAFQFNQQTGMLTQIQSIPSLPVGYEGKGQSTAELIMHPSGKFLYGSNRGHDSIVAYAVDPQTGRLTLVGHTSTEGKTPRGFGVDPTGQWAFAGNQGSDSIVQFKINQTTGALTPTGTAFELGAPVCFQFLQLK
jgi:6-phosphogluconolactonase